jgi:cytochrome c1
MVQAGCGACHRIPGVPGADGLAGPSLQGEGRRIYIAGVLPNLPQSMVRWISDPQGVLPGNAMPDTGLRPQDAQAIAAYLERLK